MISKQIAIIFILLPLSFVMLFILCFFKVMLAAWEDVGELD